MFSSDTDRHPSKAITSITGIGAEHVRLSYHYLDTGDIDAYGSLLDQNVQIRHPGAYPAHGREDAVALRRKAAAARSRHTLYKVVADGDSVAVVGRLTGRPLGHRQDDSALDVDFADIFTLSGEGLILACRTFYFAAPHSADRTT